MHEFNYRPASDRDARQLAELRVFGSGSVDYWADRIAKYARGEVHPQQALGPRVMYLATHGNRAVGFVAGHLTQRLDCDGELQWIDTHPKFQHQGIASQLVRLLAAWFVARGAHKICVDPGNPVARAFYAKNGATELNEHWMYWDDIRAII